MTEPRRSLREFAGPRLGQQLDFILEIDRLKSVLRQTILTDSSRRENSAEHSWHIAVMVLVLSEHSHHEINALKVLKMLLVHDLVEIDAGDTFCYDADGNRDKEERESRAADRLFGLLPADQGADLRSLWEEFEERNSPEACFAAALDRLQPMLHNYVTAGHSWQKHGIKKHQVVERNQPIQDGSPALWELAGRFLDDAVERGYLTES